MRRWNLEHARLKLAEARRHLGAAAQEHPADAELVAWLDVLGAIVEARGRVSPDEAPA